MDFRDLVCHLALVLRRLAYDVARRILEQLLPDWLHERGISNEFICMERQLRKRANSGNVLQLQQEKIPK